MFWQQKPFMPYAKLGHVLWGILFCLSPMTYWGQTTGEEVAVVDTVQVDSTPWLKMPLAGPWELLEEEQVWTAPFELGESVSTARLSLRFPRPTGVSDRDTLYLYMEGLAWQAELLLNDYYLGVHEAPFTPVVMPIAGNWLREADNHLLVRLAKGASGAHEPKAFLGIFRPAWLLGKSAWQAQGKSTLSPPVEGTVGMVAPYYGPVHRHQFDSLTAIRMLLPMLRSGIKQVHFWYTPSAAMQQLCADLGFRQVGMPKAGTPVAMINAYPYERAFFNQPPAFWLDEQGQRQAAYGTVQNWESRPEPTLPKGDLWGIACLLLMPLMGAFVIKLASPGFFAAQSTMLSQPSLFMDNTYYSNITSTGALLLLTIIRMLVLTSTLTLTAYYVQQQAMWSTLHLLTQKSLFFRVFGEEVGLVELWGFSLLVIGGVEGIRHLILGIIGQVFQVKGLLSSVMSLDLIGSFPLVLLLNLPLGLLLFPQAGGYWLAVGLLVLAVGGYWLRRIYVNYQGLDRGAAFSSGMKFLYICTFNFIPILIWL